MEDQTFMARSVFLHGSGDDEQFRFVDTKSIRSSVERRIRERGTEIRKALEKKMQRIFEEAKSPDFIKTKDKFAFSLGVFNTCCVCYMAGAMPQLIDNMYVVWIIPLLAIRFFQYHKQQMHYFMLDECYLANCLLLFYLFLLPTASTLFSAAFAVCNGPVVWSIAAWRNSLVFHDLDKVTSLFIHILPAIATFCVRWNPSHGTLINENLSYSETYILGIMFHVYWQMMYYLKVEVVEQDRMKRHPEIVTALRYFERTGRGVVARIVNKYPAKYRPFVFMAAQALFFLVTLIPVPLLYRYCTAHLCLIVMCAGVSVYNGANFYFEQFSIQYRGRFERITRELDHPQGHDEQ